MLQRISNAVYRDALNESSHLNVTAKKTVDMRTLLCDWIINNSKHSLLLNQTKGGLTAKLKFLFKPTLKH